MPVKVFMHKMKEYAKQQQNRKIRSLTADKKIDWEYRYTFVGVGAKSKSQSSLLRDQHF